MKVTELTPAREEYLWRWPGPSGRRNDGYLYYRRLAHRPQNSSTRLYTTGDVVSHNSSVAHDVWIAQVLIFYSTEDTTDGMYMRLRRLNTKSQVIANQNQNQHARLLGIDKIGWNQLLWSDQVEHNANHVLNIHSKVNITQTEKGFQRYLRAGKSASQTYIVR